MIYTIKKAFKQAKYGVAVNFLDHKYAKNSDLSAIRGYKKEELYKLFQNEFNEFHTVELHDGYIKNDFTIYIKKREFFNQNLTFKLLFYKKIVFIFVLINIFFMNTRDIINSISILNVTIATLNQLNKTDELTTIIMELVRKIC